MVVYFNSIADLPDQKPRTSAQDSVKDWSLPAIHDKHCPVLFCSVCMLLAVYTASRHTTGTTQNCIWFPALSLLGNPLSILIIQIWVQEFSSFTLQILQESSVLWNRDLSFTTVLDHQKEKTTKQREELEQQRFNLECILKLTSYILESNDHRQAANLHL